MKTNKRYIKHINVELYKGAKEIELAYTRFNGRVYYECLIIQNFTSENGKYHCRFDLTETEWVDFLQDLKEILKELNKYDVLYIYEYQPEIQVNFGAFIRELEK